MFVGGEEDGKIASLVDRLANRKKRREIGSIVNIDGTFSEGSLSFRSSNTKFLVRTVHAEEKANVPWDIQTCNV